MSQLEKAVVQKYQDISQLLMQLLELDDGAAEQVRRSIENYGVCHFFNNFEALDIPPEIIEKLQSLKLLLSSINGELENGRQNGGDE